MATRALSGAQPQPLVSSPVPGPGHDWTWGQQAGDGTTCSQQRLGCDPQRTGWSSVPKALAHTHRPPLTSVLSGTGRVLALDGALGDSVAASQATCWGSNQKSPMHRSAFGAEGACARKQTHTCGPHSWTRQSSLSQPLSMVGSGGPGQEGPLPFPRSSCQQPLAGGLPQRKFSGSAGGGRGPWRGAPRPTPTTGQEPSHSLGSNMTPFGSQCRPAGGHSPLPS